jgi:hypothetical protein
MAGQPTPDIFVEPFAVNATPDHIQNPIPETTATPGRASFDQGFPAITMQPVIAGGKPPYGQDMNGILFMITAALAALQAGQLTAYNGDLATAMGGYKLGAVVAMSNGAGLWFNTLNGNTSDPDASGANWVPLYRYGYTTIVGLTGGVVTPSLVEAAAPVIILQGALVANLQVVLPNSYREWLIVNATSGAFTTTVRTAGGTGVGIPQGGFNAPVRVYGNGIDLFPGAGTITTPGSISPDPNTLVLRDNLGQVYATHLVQTAGLEVPTVGAVLVQDVSADGVLRKISLNNLQAQMLLQSIGGQLVNAQVPYGVVAQHAPALFTSPNFTGVPTAPTAAPGTANTQVATTAFANPAGALAINGFQPLPSGLILMWGIGTAAPNGFTTFAYPVLLTTFSIAVASGAFANPNAQDNTPGVTAAGLAGLQVYNANDNPITTWWFAVGI